MATPTTPWARPSSSTSAYVLLFGLRKVLRSSRRPCSPRAPRPTRTSASPTTRSSSSAAPSRPASSPTSSPSPLPPSPLVPPVLTRFRTQLEVPLSGALRSIRSPASPLHIFNHQSRVRVSCAPRGGRQLGLQWALIACIATQVLPTTISSPSPSPSLSLSRTGFGREQWGLQCFTGSRPSPASPLHRRPPAYRSKLQRAN